MRLALVLLVVGCATDPGVTESPGPSPEIDGEYLDAAHGVCVGGVGGTTRCSGNLCVALGEQACGTATGCFIAYQDTAGSQAFRQCLPVSVEQAAPAGACATLGAEQCASREDCAGVYSGVSIFSSFVACQADVFHGRRRDELAPQPANRSY